MRGSFKRKFAFRRRKKLNIFQPFFLLRIFGQWFFSMKQSFFPAENRWNSKTDFSELQEHVWNKNRWRFEWKQLLKVSECFYKSIFYCEQYKTKFKIYKLTNSVITQNLLKVDNITFLFVKCFKLKYCCKKITLILLFWIYYVQYQRNWNKLFSSDQTMFSN